MKFDEIYKNIMFEQVEYKIGAEIDYKLSTLKKLLKRGYGLKVIATGGGISDSIEFGSDIQKSEYVKNSIEKGKLNIILSNAKEQLKYSIEPTLKNKGRKLIIVITELPQQD